MGVENTMVDYDENGRVQVEVITARGRGVAGAGLGGVWWSFLLRGVFATALGLFALFWPTQSLSVLALAVGFYLVADGTAGLIAALRASARGRYLLQPIVSLAIGAVLMFWPEGSLQVLLAAFGAWLGIIGVNQVLNARQFAAGDPARTALMAIGAIVALLGLVLLLAPGGGLVVITWAIGFAALVVGAHLTFFALQLRRLQRGVGGPRL
jgi:uncharacterized membrane protein HdeD (DUF308 family)